MPLPKVNGSSAARDPLSIGNLAIAKGYATREQVLQALEKQEERMPIGEILVEDDVLTHAQLEELLMEQEIARKKMSPHRAAKLVRERKREKMKEVSQGLRDVATSLSVLAKT